MPDFFVSDNQNKFDMKFILGKKIEMTQVFKEDGTVTPVTAVFVGSNYVTQVKTKEKDGYNAVQVGFGEAKKMNKAKVGHLKDIASLKSLREFRVEEADLSDLKRGDKITAEVFVAGDEVDVIGVSKGKGFQGVVKRHGFHGQKATHGHKDQERMPGSIGAGGVQRVFKGVRMAGRMGGDNVTVKNLQIVEIDSEKGILYVKGAVPGGRNGLLFISGDGKMEIKKESAPVESIEAEEIKTEEVKAEVEEVKAEEIKQESAEEIKEEAKS